MTQILKYASFEEVKIIEECIPPILKYIIDQIMIKTGLSVKVIDIPQEIFLSRLRFT
jgi:hypothetical protein